ncbi:hypothetical protein NL418_004915 [Escherichia coli]|nr:hypothetical protein [Escherichia coli]WCQ54435.1 hypothetical protein NL418_004915 [Escherichia coli]
MCEAFLVSNTTRQSVIIGQRRRLLKSPADGTAKASTFVGEQGQSHSRLRRASALAPTSWIQKRQANTVSLFFCEFSSALKRKNGTRCTRIFFVGDS